MWGLARRKQDWRVSGLVHCAKHFKLLDCRACIGFYTPRYEGKIGTRNSPKTPHIAPFKNTRKANKGRDTENRFRERVGLSTPSLYVYGPKEWCPIHWAEVRSNDIVQWHETWLDAILVPISSLYSGRSQYTFPFWKQKKHVKDDNLALRARAFSVRGVRESLGTRLPHTTEQRKRMSFL